jgi:hypothetical protein
MEHQKTARKHDWFTPAEVEIEPDTEEEIPIYDVEELTA